MIHNHLQVSVLYNDSLHCLINWKHHFSRPRTCYFSSLVNNHLSSYLLSWRTREYTNGMNYHYSLWWLILGSLVLKSLICVTISISYKSYLECQYSCLHLSWHVLEVQRRKEGGLVLVLFSVPLSTLFSVQSPRDWTVCRFLEKDVCISCAWDSNPFPLVNSSDCVLGDWHLG